MYPNRKVLFEIYFLVITKEYLVTLEFTADPVQI
jgi:hypothetical protein